MQGLRPYWTALGALGVLVCAMAARAALEPAFGSPAVGAAFDAPFALVDQSGRPFTERDLDGKPHVLVFGYTACPDICPTTLFALSTWIGDLGPAADRARYVFVTVDPGRDTPGALSDYLGVFSPRLIGLTGDPAAVAGMLDAYHVFRARVPDPAGGYFMNHTATIFLVDAAGRLEDTLSPNAAEATALAKLRRLVAD